MRPRCSLAFLLIAAAACAMADSPAANGTATDDAAIRELIGDWTVMLNLRDTNALPTLVTDDYHAVTPDGQRLDSRADLHAALAREYAAMPAAVSIESTIDFVAFQGPDAAFAGGRYQNRGAPILTPPGGAWLMTFSRDSAGWRIRGALSAPSYTTPALD